eukprot:Clim_evm137s157 gene=Clim_evmTU137s157
MTIYITRALHLLLLLCGLVASAFRLEFYSPDELLPHGSIGFDLRDEEFRTEPREEGELAISVMFFVQGQTNPPEGFYTFQELLHLARGTIYHYSLIRLTHSALVEDDETISEPDYFIQYDEAKDFAYVDIIFGDVALMNATDSIPDPYDETVSILVGMFSQESFIRQMALEYDLQIRKALPTIDDLAAYSAQEDEHRSSRTQAALTAGIGILVAVVVLGGTGFAVYKYKQRRDGATEHIRLDEFDDMSAEMSNDMEFS